ncbi:allantoicase [Ornithinimicrobium faecis]|uniref:Probable allantoicase n=1 Tax=Ornithinimicrobium faecis TaxID=2934158 RepID=A0ABY4YVS1_9MICO|nr:MULTISPECIES: allantoicase [unclassified Ornithinimicrobium]USQ80687.1 allantoicase [Ornithinimicrobium sp. HY1793]
MTNHPDRPEDSSDTPEFLTYPDLASRALAGSVVAANDELFAQRENLISAHQPAFDPADFGHKGKVYDGWETRRRRDDGNDWAIVRLGVPGVVHGLVVDTAWFRGNYPPFVSVEAVAMDGYPSVPELLEADWHTLLPRSDARGDAPNYYAVDSDRRWTHVRLSIYPDGGVARFRVHGEAVPDPDFLVGTIDLAAAENGGRLAFASDAFYSSPAAIILPGRARNMGEGWENARRRGPGNDYAIFTLAHRGAIRHVEVDTSYYVGNAPGWVRLSAVDLPSGADLDTGADSGPGWTDLLARTAVQPDTRHRFLVDAAVPATHLRLDVYPDGGLSRLRAWGELSAEDLESARLRYDQTRP